MQNEPVSVSRQSKHVLLVRFFLFFYNIIEKISKYDEDLLLNRCSVNRMTSPLLLFVPLCE